MEILTRQMWQNHVLFTSKLDAKGELPFVVRIYMPVCGEGCPWPGLGGVTPCSDT